MASKRVTREEAEGKRQKAVDFLDRIGQPDKADEFRDMSTEEYIQHKGLQVTNTNRRRNCSMAANNLTKSDLQEQLDSIEEILDSAYQVESSREDMAQAISQALDILQEGEDEDEDLSEDSDDDGSD